MMQQKTKSYGNVPRSKVKVSKSLSKFLLPLILLAAISGGLYAQTEADAETVFPAGDFWSLDAGLGMGGLMEDGKSVQLVIDPKLWLSPRFMVGARAGVSYGFEIGAPNPDPDATSDTVMLESQAYFRWNFLRLGKNENKKTDIFAQAGLGILAAYRGNESPFDDGTKTRGSLLLEGALGVTIPLNERWHIEPQVRGGYPYVFGVLLTVGYKFPRYQETEYTAAARTE